MTEGFTWYRILIESDRGTKDWFTIIYRDGRLANIAANQLVSNVPEVRAATVYRNEPADPLAKKMQDTFIAEYRRGPRA